MAVYHDSRLLDQPYYDGRVYNAYLNSSKVWEKEEESEEVEESTEESSEENP